MNKKIKTPSIIYSRNDIKSNIRIPNIMDQKLAEFLGVMVGDGHIGLYRKRNGNSYTHYELRITGNIQDYDYYENYLNDQIFKVFNIRFNLRTQQERNAVILSKDSKAIFTFLNQYMQLPTNKRFVEIPEDIMVNNKTIKSAFIRGLADSDFCLTIRKKNYPTVQGCSISRNLIKQVSDILTELEIRNIITKESNYNKKRGKEYISYRVYINGHVMVRKFITKIGFSNKNKLKE